ncbi:PucR family transcriptional regulator [Cumulibacter soli]|uniref:PucR family transcriptional regulator n=1 Tax=Cumulibacter soli TaxID=2546344 RepID=UPI00106730ED|nr:PucR family transcriptional regulator [Cumulibacter soli]
MVDTHDTDLEQLYREVLSDVDEVSKRVVDAIRKAAPIYESFPYEVQYRDNLSGLTGQLRALIDGRAPSEKALEYMRRVARERVRHGIPLADSIEGFHVMFRELWREVLTRARQRDPALESKLASRVEDMWQWTHLISAAFSDEYVAASRSATLSRADAMRKIVMEELADAGVQQDVEGVLVGLGYDLDEPFRAFVSRPLTSEVIDRVEKSLKGATSKPVHAAGFNRNSVIITQQMTAEEGLRILAKVGFGSPIGIGLARRGILGLRRSYRDGQQLLELPRREDPRNYERDWLLVLLHSDEEGLKELLRPGWEAAERHPYIADCMVAFANNGFSISAAARAVHVHPNTARYRIDRWKELTGWDVFTPGGLFATLAVLTDW